MSHHRQIDGSGKFSGWFGPGGSGPGDGSGDVFGRGVRGDEAEDAPGGLPGADGRLIPWERLEKRIRPFYPKAGRGRRPYPLSVMLRIHCVELFYDMSDPGMEDLLYKVESVRRFAGVRLSGPIPDEQPSVRTRYVVGIPGAIRLTVVPRVRVPVFEPHGSIPTEWFEVSVPFLASSRPVWLRPATEAPSNQQYKTVHIAREWRRALWGQRPRHG